MTQKVSFEFVPLETATTQHTGAYMARIPSGIVDRDQLFDVLEGTLKLPEYFGRNWDALDECLGDLTWISEHHVVIMHDELPRGLGKTYLATYLKILSDAVRFWQDRKEHTFSVVFPPSQEFEVRSLLGT